MIEIREEPQCISDYGVRPLAAKMGDETHSACVVLK